MDPITNWVVLSLGAALFSWYFQRRRSKNNQSVTSEVQSAPTTLATFIDENHKLITTLGALTALTVFVGNFPVKLFSSLLSFLFLITTIIVWLELSSKFPKSKTMRLFWFQNVIDIAVPILVLFLVLQFRALVRPFLSYLTFLAVIWLGYVAINRFNVFERIETKIQNRRLSYMVEVLLIALVLSCYFGLSIILSSVFDYVVGLLDKIVSTLP